MEYAISLPFRFLTKACDLNDGQSCFKVGVEFENSKYTQDIVAALEFYEKACKSKFIKGCTAAGMLYSQKKEIRTDLRASYGFFKKSCTNDESFACDLLGEMYQKGLGGVKKSNKLAKQSFKKSCDLKNGHGCSNLGLMYYYGLGAKKDLGRSFNLFRLSCDYNSPQGCSNLGNMYINGYGVDKDLNRLFLSLIGDVKVQMRTLALILDLCMQKV